MCGTHTAPGESQVVLLQNSGENHLHFDLRECCPDAVTRAAAEGQERVWSVLAHLIRGEAVGVESRWVMPVTRVTMGKVDRIQDALSGADRIALKFEIGSRNPRTEMDGRIEAERLVDDLIQIA